MKLFLSSAELGITAMLSVAGYIAAQIFSDILSLKIAVVAGLAIDGGTVIYPLTFTLRDMVHKTWGRRMARAVIITAGAINLIMAGLFSLVIALPPDSAWGLQKEFSMILGPVWRIVLASIVAEIVAELIDTEAYSFWVKKVTTRYQWARVLFSNAISIPIDSVLFCFLAFFGTMPVDVVWQIVLANVLVKGGMTIVSLPGIYLVPDAHEA